MKWLVKYVMLQILLLYLITNNSIFATETTSNSNVQSPLFLLSIPKAGTHLLKRTIELLTGRVRTMVLEPGRSFGDVNMPTPELLKDFIVTTGNNFRILHMPYNAAYDSILKNYRPRIILIYRDPRDQLVSRVHYMKRPRTFPTFKFKRLTFDHLLLSYIGSPNQPFIGMQSWIFERNKDARALCNIQQMYDSFLLWSNNPDCLMVRFEDLVGSKGGGSDQKQYETLQAIAAHLNLPVSHEKILSVANNLFGNTPTFREGQIGSWKKHFTSIHKMAFKHAAPGLLTRLGYEPDDSW